MALDAALTPTICKSILEVGDQAFDSCGAESGTAHGVVQEAGERRKRTRHGNVKVFWTVSGQEDGELKGRGVDEDVLSQVPYLRHF